MKYLSILIILALFFFSCEKRYEDGPCISFVKAENRLCGIWRIQNVVMGEVDASAESMDTLANFHIAFFMNNSKALYVSISDTSETVLAESVVRYNERFTELTFNALAIAGYEGRLLPLYHNCPALAQEHLWTITQLKKAETSLETEGQSVIHRLELRLETDYPNL